MNNPGISTKPVLTAVAEPSTKSLEILSLLADQPNLSQRDIAHASGLSLGMVNLVLKRLAKTGYLKITNLDGRKMRYLLTAKGLAEKTNRSYQYVLRAVETYRRIHEHITGLVDAQMAQGRTRFIVSGEGEIAELVKLVLRDKSESIKFTTSAEAASADVDDKALVIHCDINNQKVDGISVLESVFKIPSQQRKSTGDTYELV